MKRAIFNDNDIMDIISTAHGAKKRDPPKFPVGAYLVGIEAGGRGINATEHVWHIPYFFVVVSHTGKGMNLCCLQAESQPRMQDELVNDVGKYARSTRRITPLTELEPLEMFGTRHARWRKAEGKWGVHISSSESGGPLMLEPYDSEKTYSSVEGYLIE